ncbi:MAG TPA: hypothetical protein VN611_01410 [Patescibacteria group bacterium]|nr:hypothetical protein [Patescibacteria group bacterium]
MNIKDGTLLFGEPAALISRREGDANDQENGDFRTNSKTRQRMLLPKTFFCRN